MSMNLLGLVIAVADNMQEMQTRDMTHRNDMDLQGILNTCDMTP